MSLRNNCEAFNTNERTNQPTCCQVQNVIVKQGMIKTTNTKTSLLHFLHQKLSSLRAWFAKQNHPSDSLVSAVRCETKHRINVLVSHAFLFQNLTVNFEGVLL